ncbi:MAG: Rab family GTPase [Marinicella sp.]|nr:GTP-binding protein [Xanthomonadales bacterium]
MISKKICLIGRFAVGKTSLVDRFVKNHFAEKYQTTVGVAISTKIMNETTKLIIWDIAGFEQENHYKPYLRGAHGIVYVVDATEPESIHTLDLILADSPELKDKPAVCFINKADLKDDIKWQDEFDAKLSQIVAQSFWTSAKTGENVESGFATLSQLLQ